MLGRSIAAALMLAATAAPAAQISVTATPVFHGELRVRRSSGTLDRKSGNAVVVVRRWDLQLASHSNGIFPAEEPIVIAIGEDSFRLDAGAMHLRGKRGFVYRAPTRPDRGVERLTIRPEKNGTYAVQFKLRGVQLFGLDQNAPLCLPTAFIVGDDDGFAGVNYDSPGAPPIVSRRVVVGVGRCNPRDWPWA